MSTLAHAFGHVSPAAVSTALPRFARAEHPVGHVLMTEGEPGDSLLFLERGHLQLSSGGLALKTLQPGAFVGEISLFGPGGRTVTATALDEVVVHTLSRSAFEALRTEQHPVAWELERLACHSLAARMHELAEELAELGRRSHLVEILPGPLSVGRPLPSTPAKISSVLLETPGFAKADPGWLASVAAEMEVRRWQAGEHLTTVGHGAMGFVVVVSGEIERFAAVEPTRGVRLAVWGPGAMVGVAGLVDPRPMRGFVLAASDVVALVAPESQFKRWLQSQSDQGSWFRTAVVQDLSHQVTNANATQSVLHLLQR